MKLLLTRTEKNKHNTIGILSIDGIFFCNTLEDTDRGLKQTDSIEHIEDVKVFGETAIPTGTYKVDMNTVSPKFKDKEWAKPYEGKLPRLVDVPGFEGVLTHIGNSEQDSLGCVLVGEKSGDKLINSTKTFKQLMNVLTKTKEDITITII